MPETYKRKASQYNLALFRPDLPKQCLNAIKFRQSFSILFQKCCRLLKLCQIFVINQAQSRSPLNCSHLDQKNENFVQNTWTDPNFSNKRKKSLKCRKDLVENLKSELPLIESEAVYMPPRSLDTVFREIVRLLGRSSKGYSSLILDSDQIGRAHV